MNMPVFDDLSVGDAIPSLTLPPLSRLTLALYCGASGDHNPIHVDGDFARNEAGLEDVIGPGMLTMAYMGRMLTDWVPQTAIRRFSTRFHVPTGIGDRITCSGTIVDKENTEDQIVKIDLRATREDGTCLASGNADIIFARKIPGK